MDDLQRLQFADLSWNIEEYHRGVKQYCGVERSQVRPAKAQRNHIGLAIRTFLWFALYSFKTEYSWLEAKYSIIGKAVRHYMQNLTIDLVSTA